MKKALLASLFCAAMIVSAAGSVKPNETSNREQINNAIIDAPKLKKQNLNATGKISTEYSFGNVAESLINELGTVGVTNGGIAEHMADIDLSAQVDLGKYEHIITKPDITGPIFDPNPGSGGGGGTSTTATYTDRESEYDDYSYWANPIGEQGKLVGSITRHNSNEINVLKQKGDNPSVVDKDWFRFTVTRKYKYTFNFSAEASGYYFELLRFSDMALRGKLKEDLKHTSLYSSRDGSRSYTSFLEPATYFICVTAISESAIASYGHDTYVLNYSYANVADGEASIDLRTDSSPVVIWENDTKPFQVKRWGEEKQTVLVCTSESKYGQNCDKNIFEGYIDPVFMNNHNWKPADGENFSLDYDLRLDSVTYICDIESIRNFEKIVLFEMNALNSQQMAQYRNEHLKFVKAEIRSQHQLVNGAIEVSFAIVAAVVGAACPAAGIALGVISVIISSIELGVTIADSLSLDFKDYDEKAPTPSQLADSLRLLDDTCLDIIDDAETYNSYRNVLQIPKYSYFRYTEPKQYKNIYDEETDTDYMSGSGSGSNRGNKYPYSRNDFNPRVYQWVSTSFVAGDLYRSDHFKKARSEINRYSSNYITGSTQYRGTLKKFSSYYNYVNYTKVGKNIRRPRLLNYGIYKNDDGHYYFVVNNPTNMAHLITYNTKAPVNENQSKKFNFKADSYASELISPGRNYSFFIEKRNYVWIRENWNDYVFKVSLKNNQIVYEGDAVNDATHPENLYTFGMEYVKLAIVGKSGSTWKIRIWNLSDRNIRVNYNTKMCFNDHAKFWTTDLVHWQNTDVRILYNNYADVDISEYGTATAIAVSYVLDDIRYVSWADQLNNWFNANTLSYNTHIARPEPKYTTTY